MKPRLLSGDTPTGRLHLGHWVGSVENRVKMQDEYDCYFLIANIQAFTTRMDRPAEVHQNVMEVMLDYLAVGIDPRRSTIFIQSEIPVSASTHRSQHRAGRRQNKASHCLSFYLSSIPRIRYPRPLSDERLICRLLPLCQTATPAVETC